MNPHRLRVLLEVSRAGSIGGASDHLVVSPPAVTAAIRALEGDVGTRLVARQGRGIALTPAGEVLAWYAARVLGLLDEARLAVSEEGKPEQGRVRLAAVMTFGESVLPRMIRQFTARYPNVGISLEVGNRRVAWRHLQDHEVDLAVTGDPPPTPDLTAEPFLRNDRIIVAGSALGLRRGRADPNDLASATWLLREPGSGSRAATEEFLAGVGIAPPILTMSSNGAIVESVALGLGITLISHDAVRRQVEAGRVRVLSVRGLPLKGHWYVVRRANEAPRGAAALFLDFLRRLATAGTARGLRGAASSAG